MLQTHEQSISVIDGTWRYTRYETGEEELYNVREDPHEWHNLAADPEYDAIKRRQGKRLPPNPAPRGKGKKAKNLTLRLDGESFEWVPRGQSE